MNFVLYLHLILFINVTIPRAMEFMFLQPPYLQKYADAVAGKGAP